MHLSKYISYRNIFESLIEWKEMEAEELILIQSNSKYNIYHTKITTKFTIISIVSSSLQSHVTLWELLLAQRDIKHIGGSWDIVKTKSWKAFMLLDNI